MEWFERSQRESERRGLGFVARDAMWRRACLLAQRGDLDGAQLELTRAGRPRAPGGAASAATPRRLSSPPAAGTRRRPWQRRGGRSSASRPGLVCYRVWAALDIATVLGEVGSHELASQGDRGGPVGPRRAVPRRARPLPPGAPAGDARLARLRPGEPGGGVRRSRLCWEEAGDNADQLVRAHWAQLRPILWRALADRAIEPATVVPALERALPGGEALVAFTDHPEPSVRSAALSAALASNHPAVLSRLAELADDPDEQVAVVGRGDARAPRRGAAAPPVRGPRAASGSRAPGGRSPTGAGSAPSTPGWCACCSSTAGSPVPEDRDLRGSVAGAVGGERSRRPPRGRLPGPAACSTCPEPRRA